MVFLVVAWLLFVPSTFGQRLVAFGVAAGLMVYLVNVIDGAQRRSIDRLRLRMVMERDLAVARALADEREQVLKEFLGAFVVKVHGSAGDMLPYGGPLAINVGGQPVGHQAMTDGDGRDHSRGAPGPAPRAPAGR
jgi:hypothetical protein